MNYPDLSDNSLPINLLDWMCYVWFATRSALKSEIESMHMHYASRVEEALKSCKLVKGERLLIAPQGPSLILKAA